MAESAQKAAGKFDPVPTNSMWSACVVVSHAVIEEGEVVRLNSSRSVIWTEPNSSSTVTPETVFIGPDRVGLGGFQVAVASSATPPSRQVLRDLFAARRDRTQVQLVVAIVHAGMTHLFGPDPQRQPLEMPTEQVRRQLQSVLDEPDVLFAVERLAGFRKAHESTVIAGWPVVSSRRVPR